MLLYMQEALDRGSAIWLGPRERLRTAWPNE